ncbi:hypothetical protein A5821_001976 [Enterococcus sp. 7F3_DIV0205]|uniref:HTH cro/C1-type domain-containing protein n=1 Tax=Candidatus Enterococcus palustris TaxID=1834189 RepID=A0AAQ3Y7M8_9ENTE|nr:helix-turn-helix domain-containing protein [Enterococcus sp. 7F3_DIV0205]OTN82414.1 hypothetical protein A5821_002325 [Enterococcus sp. 7F3_DIV0205]
MIAIGSKLKELRESKKITQKELAEFLNVTPQTISKWERDKSYPDLDTLVKLSKYFQISTDKLLGNNKHSFFETLFSKKEGKAKMKKEIRMDDESIYGSEKILVFGITSMMTDYEVYTGLLVTKMNNLARTNNLGATIQAYSVSKIDEKGKEADRILLCPELSYAKEEIKRKFPEIPVTVISKKEYAALNAEKILKEALA